jgi:xanthine/uracil permease
VRAHLGDWLGGQSPFVQLVLTNPVVLALLLAIGLNLVLNGLRRPTAEAAS